MEIGGVKSHFGTVSNNVDHKGMWNQLRIASNSVELYVDQINNQL